MGCDCINSSLLSFYLLYFKNRHYLAYTNSEDPDQITGALSDQGLYCLQTSFLWNNIHKYSRLSLSRLRLSRITAYLAEKI